MQVKQVYQTVDREFAQVNELIGEQLSSHVPLVEKIGHYIVDSGGKRLRPLLVLLTAGALKDEKAEQIALATVIEFLHTATLLHDDVVDTSDMRRGKATANARWGNAPSVLVGDFLYSRAFQLMVQMNDLKVMDILADATNVIAEGEVMQLMNCKNPDVSVDQYMEVILNKTAMLFQAASHASAVLAGADEDTANAMRDYGLNLGLAFQLIDDVLDYRGSADEMGKNVGDDLAEGKPTLPLIHVMQTGSDDDRQLVRNAIRQGGLENLAPIKNAVERAGALDYTVATAQQFADKAIACLEKLDETPYKSALSALTRIAINRNQ